MTTQAIVSSITIPPAPIPADTFMYFVEVKFGKVSYFPERETGRTTWAAIVADMMDAELTDVSRIIAVDVVHHTSWDATREAADQIFTRLIRSGSNLPAWLIDFLEANISMNELAPYLRKLAA